MADDKGEAEDLFREGYTAEREGKYYLAKGLYEKAMEKGHVKAIYNLGYLYNIGSGVPRNILKAKELYKQAVEKGCNEARYSLGLILTHLGAYDQALDQYRQYIANVIGDLSKEEQKGKLQDIAKDISRCLNSDLSAFLIQEYFQLRLENARLLQENNSLRTELEYSPGMEGYQRAKEEFESLCSAKSLQAHHS